MSQTNDVLIIMYTSHECMPITTVARRKAECVSSKDLIVSIETLCHHHLSKFAYFAHVWVERD